MAKIELLAPITFKWEGGYQCQPEDKGNYNSRGELVGTKYGVSAMAYESHYSKVPTKADMQNLTPEQGAFVLQSYWNGCKAGVINNQSIANLLVDFNYNSGGIAIKKIQTILGLNADGIVGEKTIAAINAADSSELFAKLWKCRKQYLQDIVVKKPELQKYLTGWLNRLNDFKFNGNT